MKIYRNKEFSDSLLSTDPKKFFDLHPTISHLFRFRHAALKYRSYGEIFCKRLIDEKVLNPKVKVIVELGGGLGDFAYGFLSWLKLEIANGLKLDYKYIIITENAILQKEQQQKLKAFGNVEFVISNSDTLPFNNNEIKGLFIINQLLQSYESVELTEEEWKNSEDPVILQMKKSKIQRSFPLLINIGVGRLMLEITRILDRESSCVIVESGSMDKVELKNGRITLSFADLLALADRLKLFTLDETLRLIYNHKFTALMDFLEFRKDIRVTNLTDIHALSKGDPLAGWQIYAISLDEVKAKYSSYGKDFDKLGDTLLQNLNGPTINQEGFPDEGLSCKDCSGQIDSCTI